MITIHDLFDAGLLLIIDFSWFVSWILGLRHCIYTFYILYSYT